MIPGPTGEEDAWPASLGVVHYSVAVPDEKAARSVAGVLRDRGHRWVTVTPLHRLRQVPQHHLIRKQAEFSAPELAGWWHAGSMVDEQVPPGFEHAPEADAEYFQRECERAVVEATARDHRGFAAEGWTSLRAATLREPGGEPAPELFDLGGLVHELDQGQAHAARRSVIAGFPPRPERPLRPECLDCDDEDDEDDEDDYPALLECVQDVARRLRTGQDPLPEVVAEWLTAEDDDYEDDHDVDFSLYDSVMRQGVCFPHTAAGVPLFAGLAVHDDVRPARRADSVARLFEAATIGQRAVAYDADRRFALGLPMTESADERSARLAVEAAVPGLLRRWDRESEAMRFTLAALAAAFPEAARSTGSIDRVRDLTAQWTGGPRGDALRFALALAEDEPRGLSAAWNAYLEQADRRPGDAPSPHAPARGAALEVLKTQVNEELRPLLFL